MITLQAFSKRKSNTNVGSIFKVPVSCKSLIVKESTYPLTHTHTSLTQSTQMLKKTHRYEHTDCYTKRDPGDNHLCFSQNDVKRTNFNDYSLLKFTGGQLIPCSTFKLAPYLSLLFFFLLFMLSHRKDRICPCLRTGILF